MQTKESMIGQYCRRLLMGSMPPDESNKHWAMLCHDVAPHDAEPLASVLQGRPTTNEFLVCSVLIANQPDLPKITLSLGQSLQVLAYGSELGAAVTDFALDKVGALLNLLSPDQIFSEEAVSRGGLLALSSFLHAIPMASEMCPNLFRRGLELLRAIASHGKSMAGILDLAQSLRAIDNKLAKALSKLGSGEQRKAFRQGQNKNTELAPLATCQLELGTATSEFF